MNSRNLAKQQLCLRLHTLVECTDSGNCFFRKNQLQSALTAKAFYVGDQIDSTTRQVVRMAVDTKAPGQAPPDLPSLLLDGRICYIGMPVCVNIYYFHF